MKTLETFAIFDEQGQMTIENQPVLKNKKVKLLIFIEDEYEPDFYALALQGLSDAYATNEPEYDLSSVNEPNSAYAAR